MKTIYSEILCLLCLLCAAACSDGHDGDLRLGGDCQVEALTLDNYEGKIDRAARSIVVQLPETYDHAAVQVTSLRLSEGAACNVRQGEVLNMDAAKVLRVWNGDAFLDWTLSVIHDEARISNFILNDLYTGTINQAAKTITVYVPATVELTGMVPTILLSTNAGVAPASGVPQDFSQPVTYTVRNNSAEATYTVTVVAIDKPAALFVGSAASMSELDPEAKAACEWMLGNVAGSLYASFADLRAGTLDLSDCKVVWWHWHHSPAVDGHDDFVTKGADALDTKNQLRSFYENGGALLLTRYATNLPSFIGATGDDEWTTPNNCWGDEENNAEVCGSPWDFRIFDGQADHPLWSNLIQGDEAGRVYCTDAGYHITNSTAQYHIGTDWGGYANYDAWTTRTGGRILGVGGDGAIVAWEYPAHDGKGGIVCIGSGCYDWYSNAFEPGYAENFHKNIATITQNAINYLTK
jgi:hypothetical protein